MEVVHRETNWRVRVEPGTYFLGDPCYTIPNDKHDEWMDLLNSCNFFRDSPIGWYKRPAGTGAVTTIEVLSFDTKYGDGAYYDQEGHYYAVDAGMIGLTPETVWRDIVDVKWLEGCGQVVTFPDPIVCKSDDGDLHFGGYHINTRGVGE